MSEKRTVGAILKDKFLEPIEEAKSIWYQTAPDIKADVDDYLTIISCFKAGLISIKPVDEENNADITDSKIHDSAPQKKIRGRKPKVSKAEDDCNVISESFTENSSNDSSSSVSSTRSRRAAAQVADHKLAQVQSFIKTKKLRRPSDHSESKLDSTASSPPIKSRKTCRKQSAGNFQDGIKSNTIKQNALKINENTTNEENTAKNCVVIISRLETTETTSTLHVDDKISSDSIINYEEDLEKNSVNNEPLRKYDNLNHKKIDSTNEKKNKSIPNKDHGISSNEEGFQNLELEHFPAAHSSPIRGPCSYMVVSDDNLNKVNGISLLDTTFVKHTMGVVNEATVIEDSRKITDENVQQNADDLINMNDSKSARSRTKVIKKDDKKIDSNITANDQNENDTGHDFKVVENASPESYVRSRTKTLRRPNDDENPENKEKVSKSAVNHNDEENQTRKTIILNSPKSSSEKKGDLVKKRIEDFEKMKVGRDEPVEDGMTRVTRNAAKNKNVIPSTEIQNIKQSRNLQCSKTTNTNKLQLTEKVRLTPLATCNRSTPVIDYTSKALAITKGPNSVNRQNNAENNSAIQVQRHAAEEMGRKRKEEEIMRRRMKEEDAKKKKEKTLKATAEETRRKREDKLQKVAAAREAAEREKAVLAAKLEKEKEDKIRQIAADKEKQKEEQLKKKILMQQRALELEERRKQDEAARMAKLKEQEEEHKRAIAMKEREQEMSLKQQKAADKRLAEVDKAKHQGFKPTKLPALNGKFNPQDVSAESSKVVKQEVQSYEITPARDERPLLKPKTENDYGIDDALSEDSSDDESRPKKMIPLWAQSKNREHLLRVNNFLPKKIWALFMEADPCPDVYQMFAGNPITKRTRTSSAVWRTPPTYTHSKFK